MTRRKTVSVRMSTVTPSAARSLAHEALCAACLVVLGLPNQLIAADFTIHDGDRVAFLGDSITEQRLYTTFIEAYALTRHPRWKLTFRNLGWSGDTAWLRNRSVIDEKALFAADGATQQKMVEEAAEHGLGRDVLPLAPTLVTIDLGMNDSYAARIEEAYPAFMRAETALVEVLKRHGMRVTLLTPQAIEGNGPAPALDGANKALGIVASGIGEIAGKTGVPVIDQYTPYLSLCVAAHAAQPNRFIYSDGGDRIHPGPTGQTVMAWIILKGMGATSLVSRASIDRSTKTVVSVEGCLIDHLQVGESALSFDRLDDALPMPIHPDAAPALALAPILADLNRYELQVTGLASLRYDIVIDGRSVSTATAEQLAQGRNLATSAGAITDQVQSLLKMVVQKNNLFFNRWRNVQLYAFPNWAQVPTVLTVRSDELARLDRSIEQLEAQIDALRIPQVHHVELRPISP